MLLSLTFTVVCAAVADVVLGEPSRCHPLVGFGNIAAQLDKTLFKSNSYGGSALIQRMAGILAVAAAIVPILVAVHFLLRVIPLWGAIIVLYLSIGAKSLFAHANDVVRALDAHDLPLARQRVGLIVSRDTTALSVEGVCRAAIESVLENGSDAIFGALFWFVVLGPLGAVLFRLANTLDAMWGYKNDKYLHFGWAAARLDDVLCFIPARLTAITYALCGNTMVALRCWRYQARLWYSPNAGPVMAAGAGALQVELGGPAIYHQKTKERPTLGKGPAPHAHDVARAIKLVQKAFLLWIVVIAAGGLFAHA